MSVKVGVKSSEFWVTIAAGLITAVGKGLGLPENVVSWIMSLALGYLGSRTILKAVAVKNGVK